MAVIQYFCEFFESMLTFADESVYNPCVALVGLAWSVETEMNVKLACIVAALAGGVVIAGATDQVQLNFLSPVNGFTGDISLNGGSWEDVYISPLTFFDLNGAMDITTVCASITEEVSDGNRGLYNVLDTTDGSQEIDPQITAANLALAGAILQANGDPAAMTSAQGAALQIAVWSALYNGTSAFSYTNVSGFQVDNNTGNVTTAVLDAAASDWSLGSNADPAGVANWFQYDGAASTYTFNGVNVGGQDQLVYNPGGMHNLDFGNVPGPAAVLPFALGLLRKRRAKKAIAA